MTGDVYLVARNSSVQLLVISEQECEMIEYKRGDMMERMRRGVEERQGMKKEERGARQEKVDRRIGPNTISCSDKRHGYEHKTMNNQ